jgi:UDP-N-acetylmuramoyl-tripeptide--D-alanyl-D-alanine ligase
VSAFRWTEREVARALGVPDETLSDRAFSEVSTDTRSMVPGALFVALRGERFDAHDFLSGAIEAGAAALVVERVPDGLPDGILYFQVPDSLLALGTLARYRRDHIRARVVGVVGSNGKTTTKDLLRAVLEPAFRVHSTQGNLNNRIGVPRTLFATPDDAEVLVIEMGTNEPGEIEILASIVRPDAVVITSIGEEHLEKLGSVEGVLREETSVLAELHPLGFAVVAESPPSLVHRAREMIGPERVRVAGFSPTSDLHPDGGADAIEVEEDGSTRWSWLGHPARLPIPGRFNVRNALLALGVAQEWGVSPEAALSGLAAVPPAKLRGEWHRIGGMRVLADCYNSNPPGVAAAVDLLASLPHHGARVVVLGTMRELGAAAPRLHAEVAAQVTEHVGRGVDLVVATGTFQDAFAPQAERLGERLVLSPDPVEAYGAAAARFRGDETILLKASRGEALERWLPLLERDFGSAGSV